MKKFIVLLFLGAGFIACKSEKKAEVKEEVTVVEVVEEIVQFEDGTYAANVETSKLNWKGFKPTGTHNGTVGIKEGNLVVSGGMLTEGNFTFDMTAITVLDIPADDKGNGKLVGHLKSPDFFDTENNPTATFKITSVEGSTVNGDLTIKGITKPISFPVSLTTADSGISLKSEPFKIDRTLFGIEYKSKSVFDNLKDKFINDEFEISFEVNASK